MGIYREVETEVTCDTCGERIKAWCSAGTGVSRVWAAHYARAEGATVGKKKKQGLNFRYSRKEIEQWERLA